MRTTRNFYVVLAAILAGLLLLGASPQKSKQAGASKSQIERGKYLVNSGLCNDCHTPKIMTAMGPMLDTTRLLSGQPASDKIPPMPDSTVLGPGKWMVVGNAHLSAWGGPWGVSFARNLTPDKNTGLGSWTPEMFIKALRTGKDMGEGRPILPPMPWEFVGKMKESDLRAIFAYLQSLPPVSNAVPDPIPPPGAPPAHEAK